MTFRLLGKPVQDHLKPKNLGKLVQDHLKPKNLGKLVQDHLKPKNFGLLSVIHQQTHMHYYCSKPIPTSSDDDDDFRNYACRVRVEDAEKCDECIPLAQFATNERNKKENEHLQFVRVVEAAFQPAAGLIAIIKLEVIVDCEPMLYLAVVWSRPWLEKIQLLEWKRVDEDFSTYHYVTNYEDAEDSEDAEDES